MPENPQLDNNPAPELAEAENLSAELAELLEENEALVEENAETTAEILEVKTNLFLLVGHVMQELQAMKQAGDPNYAQYLQQFNEFRASRNTAATAELFFSAETQQMSDVLNLDADVILGAITTLQEDASGLWYHVHFPNDQSLAKIGLGNCLSAEYKFVEVWKEGEDTPILGRQAKTEYPAGVPRMGYVDENNEYITIVNGDRFRPFRNIAEMTQRPAEYPENQPVDLATASAMVTAPVVPEAWENLSEEDFPSAEEEQALKQSYVEYEENIFRERQLFLESILPELSNKTPEEIQEYLFALNAEEVWDLRSALGPYGLQKVLREAGVYDVKLSQQKIYDMTESALTQYPFTGDLQADREILTQLMWHESTGGRIFAVSDTGALGLGQMTKRNYKTKWNFNPFIPEEAVLHAALHLHEDHKHFQNVEQTITSYNVGQGAVDSAIKRAAANGRGWHSNISSSQGRNFLGHVRAVQLDISR